MKQKILFKRLHIVILFILFSSLSGCEFSEISMESSTSLTEQSKQSLYEIDPSAIQVKDITFNHNTNSYLHDAINIRQNVKMAIFPPEYVRDRSDNYPAAYLSGTLVVLKVRFKSTIKSNYSVNIKGICSDSTGILDDTDIQKVSFSKGASEEIFFNIEKATPWDVRSGYVTWDWQVISEDCSYSFDTTDHKIYNLVNLPAHPWKQTWLHKNNPWADALDIACGWISEYSGKEVEYVSDDLHIIKAITKGIYLYWGREHKKIYSYDKNLGVSHYWGRNFFSAPLIFGYAKFKLSEVIDPKTIYIDCTDVSGVVCSLSRLMGVNNVYLKQISVGLKSIWYKPILPIGHDEWEGLYAEDDAETWMGHQVVVYRDTIFDGCVAVDPDNPTYMSPPAPPINGNWIIPAGIHKDDYKYYIYWEDIPGSNAWYYGKDLNFIDIY